MARTNGRLQPFERHSFPRTGQRLAGCQPTEWAEAGPSTMGSATAHPGDLAARHGLASACPGHLLESVRGF